MIGLIITIAILGVIVWAITTLVPMPAPFKTVIIVIACLIVLLYLLRVLGVFGVYVDAPAPVIIR